MAKRTATGSTGKTLTLTIGERNTLQGLLPAESNYMLGNILRDLRKELALSEKELKTVGFTLEGTKAVWDISKDPNKKVIVSEHVLPVITVKLKDLDSGNKLKPYHLTLYEMIVLGKNGVDNNGTDP